MGGLPNLPSAVMWPMGRVPFGARKGEPHPLHFLLQVDCAELPAGDWGLPASGMLFFFASIDSMQDDSRAWARVSYSPCVAPGEPERQPPSETPVIGADHPGGYHDPHEPKDPLTRRTYFEWPVRFAVVDTYPPLASLARLPEWRDLERRWGERARADAKFAEQFGEEPTLVVDSSDGTPVRVIFEDGLYMGLQQAVAKAFGYQGYRSDESPTRLWLAAKELMDGSFPLTAIFASAVISAVDEHVTFKISEQQRLHLLTADRRARATRGGGFLSRLFASKPVVGDALPDWVEDLKIVQREAKLWLNEVRALPPSQPLAVQRQSALLAWMKELDERRWSRIDGHKPQADRVGDVVARALLHLAQLSGSREDIRATFPDSFSGLLAGTGRAVHQLFGHFRYSQSPPPIDDVVKPFLMLSSDHLPNFRIADEGELHFFIHPDDLLALRFDRVRVQMQGS